MAGFYKQKSKRVSIYFVSETRCAEITTRPSGDIPDRTAAPKELCQDYAASHSVVLPGTQPAICQMVQVAFAFFLSVYVPL